MCVLALMWAGSGEEGGEVYSSFTPSLQLLSTQWDIVT